MNHSVCAVVVGGGSSTRYGKNKLLEKVMGVTVAELAVGAFARHPRVDSVVLVSSGEPARLVAAAFPSVKIVGGGETRAASVRNGVEAASGDIVCIHDAARPYVSEELITRVIEAAEKHGASAPFLPVRDSLREVRDGYVSGFLDRDAVRAVQTPQAFMRGEYLRALSLARGDETDDCEVAARAGISIVAVEGEESNKKITLPEDIMAERIFRIGQGYDVHRFESGRELWLCGVNIPHERGLLGHSDADAPLHALMDALLGAAGMDDIGTLFPDSDARYKGVSSVLLLREVMKRIADAGFAVANVDITVVAEAPKLSPYKQKMRETVADACGLLPSQVAVKATTEEGLGFTGERLGLAAYAAAVLYTK